MNSTVLKYLLYILSYVLFLTVIIALYPINDLSSVEFIVSLTLLQLLYLIFILRLEDRILKYFSLKSYRIVKRIQFIQANVSSKTKTNDLLEFLKIEFSTGFSSIEPILFLLSENKIFSINSNFIDLRISSDNLEKLNKYKEKFYSIPKITIPFLSELIDKIQKKTPLSYLIPLKSNDKTLGFALLPLQFYYVIRSKENNDRILRLFKTISSVYHNTLLIEELERKSRENKLIINLGRKISATLELKLVLESIFSGIKDFIDFDAGGIFLRSTNTSALKGVFTIGYEESKLIDFENKSESGLVRLALELKRPIVIPDVEKESRYYAARESTKSQITVPLFTGDEVIGAFILEKDDLNFYSNHHIDFLEQFAEQSAIAIINAKLYESSQREKLLVKEMLNAGNIQKALFPKRPPNINNFECSILNEPCKYVGGDIYDLFKYNDNELIFNIGDVSGKGSPASILMAVVYAGFRSQIRENAQMSEINARLNNLLFETTSSSHYATFFLGYVNQEKRQLIYSNAGHNPPILIRADNSTKMLDQGGIVLGFLEHQIYLQQTIDLTSGDILISFTDGLNEAFDMNDEEFGNDRIIEIVTENKDKSCRKIRDLIFEAVKDFHGRDRDLDDDFTLIVMRFNYDL
jgi:phosphoserine phosphatase RsbU/P